MTEICNIIIFTVNYNCIVSKKYGWHNVRIGYAIYKQQNEQ